MLFLLLIATSLLACSDPAERQIAALIAGGPAAEEAKMELNLAKREAVEPLIRAFSNRDHPPRARVELATAIYRLYVRETDKRLLDALVSGLADPAPAVRTAVARSIGDLRNQLLVDPTLAQFERETAHPVQLQLLTALAMINGKNVSVGGMEASEIDLDRMNQTQLDRL